jgi:uncharacterized Fe-S cluster protein YjdI
MSDGGPKEYIGKDVVVTFDAEVCQHAAECVRGLPQVFDTKKRPWIDPDGASAAEVRAQVGRCPSGALQYHDPGTGQTTTAQ